MGLQHSVPFYFKIRTARGKDPQLPPPPYTTINIESPGMQEVCNVLLHHDSHRRHRGRDWSVSIGRGVRLKGRFARHPCGRQRSASFAGPFRDVLFQDLALLQARVLQSAPLLNDSAGLPPDLANAWARSIAAAESWCSK